MAVERFPGDCSAYIYEAKFSNPGYIGDRDVLGGVLWEAPYIEEFWVYIEDGRERLDITETLSEEFLEKAMAYVQEGHTEMFDNRIGHLRSGNLIF